MEIDIIISFISASIILCFTPGPTVFLVIGQTLSYGKKSVLPLIAGVLLGDIIAMCFSFLGLGTILKLSSHLFIVVKWVGAGYLLYLGIKSFRTKAVEDMSKMPQAKQSHIFRDAMIVTALNPKGIIFFMAFFPLFVDMNNNVISQFSILAALMLFVSLLSVSTYSFFSAFLRDKITSIKAQNRFNKIGGATLVGAGVITAISSK